MTSNAMSPSSAETHISWLFFTEDRAYKLLKPLEMPFLDHREPEQRIESITREFELNRAISPDVYLGTSDVVENGELVDKMLVMQRLPADRRLSQLVNDTRFPFFLRAVARRVASLHASREPVTDAESARLPTLASNWKENFDTMRAHVGPVFDPEDFHRLEVLVTRYLKGRGDLLDARIAGGFVRDVHGDLTAEDVFCLDDGPRLIDCLAFNDKWRIIDVLNDIAFLAMDMHRLAGAEAAEHLMRWYQEFSNEHHPASLAHHYVAYRAHVRAKIACLRIGAGDDAEHVRLARHYHELALHHAERARLRLIVVGGAPGTGKTTVARAIGDRYEVPCLSSDEVRKSVTATAYDERCVTAPGQGIYTEDRKQAVYDELHREAEALLRAGTSVVVDATWSRADDRAALRATADRCGAEIVELECRLDPRLARERVARRLAVGGDASDATPEVVTLLASHRDPWPEATGLDTAGPFEATIAIASAAVTRTPFRHPAFAR